MADITMCLGFKMNANAQVCECPLRESCYRFTTPINDSRQSWLVGPFKTETSGDGEVTTCEEYWPMKITKGRPQRSAYPS